MPQITSERKKILPGKVGSACGPGIENVYGISSICSEKIKGSPTDDESYTTIMKWSLVAVGSYTDCQFSQAY